MSPPAWPASSSKALRDCRFAARKHVPGEKNVNFRTKDQAKDEPHSRASKSSADTNGESGGKPLFARQNAPKFGSHRDFPTRLTHIV